MGVCVIGVWVVTLGTAYAQGVAPGGFPPQTDLYNDAVVLARVLPLVLVAGIGFGVWQARVSLRQPKSAPNLPYVIRHDLGTVVSHWSNAIGFILGIVTGAIILRWLPRPDAVRGVFAIHYVAAGLVVFGIAGHLSQNAVTGGMRLIPRSLKDIRDGLGEIVEYTGVYGPSGAAFGIRLPKVMRETLGMTFTAFGLKPTKKIGKFLPVEKTFSYVPWAIIIAVIVITGLIKSFRYLYPIAPTFIEQVTFVHDLFAYLAVAMLVIHLAAILLVPSHWPLLISMFTTRISRRFVQQWHPVWFKELTAQEQPVAPAPRTEPASMIDQTTMSKAAK
jgi:cytochrome b subunit of formate dehydrogenase